MRHTLAVSALVVSALTACVTASEADAADQVDLELVLLADASRSIDDAEIRFQRQHYATALTHLDIMAAIASGYRQRIAITYVEWGDGDVPVDVEKLR